MSLYMIYVLLTLRTKPLDWLINDNYQLLKVSFGAGYKIQQT